MVDDSVQNYLFYDIETHRVKEFEEISPALQNAFINHYYDADSYETPSDHYKQISALHPEFSQVICISFGFEKSDGSYQGMHLYGLDEIDILNKAAQIFDKFGQQGYSLAGHNILSCDNPYLMKRYIINKLPVPSLINHMYEKPWEVGDLDTMNMWKMGGWRTNTSLETICAALGIACKSEEISGANLYTYPISEVPFEELVKYCDEDVKSDYEMVKHCYRYL
jgi:hypothetical protein